MDIQNFTKITAGIFIAIIEDDNWEYQSLRNKGYSSQDIKNALGFLEFLKGYSDEEIKSTLAYLMRGDEDE